MKNEKNIELFSFLLAIFFFISICFLGVWMMWDMGQAIGTGIDNGLKNVAELSVQREISYNKCVSEYGKKIITRTADKNVFHVTDEKNMIYICFEGKCADVSGNRYKVVNNNTLVSVLNCQ